MRIKKLINAKLSNKSVITRLINEEKVKLQKRKIEIISYMSAEEMEKKDENAKRRKMERMEAIRD